VYHKFGPPEVLSVVEIENPVPKEDEVLIKIHATTVEKEDPGMRRSPGMNGIFKPKRKILGMEFSGEIHKVGENVKSFKPGDQVFGNTGMSLGAYADYKCLNENAGIALKPVNFNFEEAVSVTNGGLTALPFLMEKGNIRKGQKVLINGASGSVGTAAVQIAKYFGTKVFGVCSTPNLELLKSLGADQVIDYTQQDFTTIHDQFDIVFDVAGKSSYSHCKKILKANGIYLTTIPTPLSMLQMLWTSRFSSKKVKFIAAGLRSGDKKAKDLNLLKKIAEENKLKPVIDRIYTLHQIADAHKYVENEKKKGSVVITMK
jgi:NADPH:quinone reductase-like Zn-dependent oxidoreductase